MLPIFYAPQSHVLFCFLLNSSKALRTQSYEVFTTMPILSANLAMLQSHLNLVGFKPVLELRLLHYWYGIFHGTSPSVTVMSQCPGYSDHKCKGCNCDGNATAEWVLHPIMCVSFTLFTLLQWLWVTHCLDVLSEIVVQPIRCEIHGRKRVVWTDLTGWLWELSFDWTLIWTTSRSSTSTFHTTTNPVPLRCSYLHTIIFPNYVSFPSLISGFIITLLFPFFSFLDLMLLICQFYVF